MPSIFNKVESSFVRAVASADIGLTLLCTTSSGASLSIARGYMGATGSSTAGYFGGGQTPGAILYSTMDKIGRAHV